MTKKKILLSKYFFELYLLHASNFDLMKLNLPLLSLLACSVVSANISVVGNPDSYADYGGDWLTYTANDIDADGLGSDGYLFFGDYLNNGSRSNQAFDRNVSNLPSYVSSVSPGAHFASVAEGFSTYGQIDNPNTLDGNNAIAGFALATSGGAGTNNEVVTFAITGLSQGQIVRVGILAGIAPNDDGRWDPTSITLSDGSSSATVGDHASSKLPNAAPSNAGWVFFDVDADGTYGISTTKRFNNQGSGIGGITFDSIISGGAQPVVYPNIADAYFNQLQGEEE